MRRKDANLFCFEEEIFKQKKEMEETILKPLVYKYH
jgi:hypothetical protein